MLPKPNRPPLSTTLGIPGYFPHSGKDQDEEKMSILNVINGYQSAPPVPVSINKISQTTTEN